MCFSYENEILRSTPVLLVKVTVMPVTEVYFRRFSSSSIVSYCVLLTSIKSFYLNCFSKYLCVLIEYMIAVIVYMLAYWFITERFISNGSCE
jgi:hypothetical protein